MSRAPGEDQRRADALRAGGALARLQVGDQARALLAGGHWIEGPFHLVNYGDAGGGNALHPGASTRWVSVWVSVAGEIIPADAVTVVRLTRNPRLTKFAEEVDDITGRNRCPGSGQPAGEITDADGPVGYCPECEQEVPAPGGRFIDHDRRGRDLHGAE
jgi:hypothetical protein